MAKRIDANGNHESLSQEESFAILDDTVELVEDHVLEAGPYTMCLAIAVVCDRSDDPVIVEFGKKLKDFVFAEQRENEPLDDA